MRIHAIPDICPRIAIQSLTPENECIYLLPIDVFFMMSCGNSRSKMMWFEPAVDASVANGVCSNFRYSRVRRAMDY
jgi:hypothetical protein